LVILPVLSRLAALESKNNIYMFIAFKSQTSFSVNYILSSACLTCWGLGGATPPEPEATKQSSSGSLSNSCLIAKLGTVSGQPVPNKKIPRGSL